MSNFGLTFREDNTQIIVGKQKVLEAKTDLRTVVNSTHTLQEKKATSFT